MGNRSPIRTLDDLRRQATVTADGCWLSPGALDRHGYGRVTYDGVQTSTHRFAYEQQHGPVATGLDLDHLCRVRACCNPAHLEPVTRAENLRRGAIARPVTVCKHGHDLTDPANLDAPSGGRRARCKPCRQARQRRYESTRRDAAPGRSGVGAP